MNFVATQDWRYRIHFSRDARTSSARTLLATRAARGDLVRICRGAYLPRETWEALDAEDRYRTLVRAAAVLDRGSGIFSHAAAAVLWRLPWLGSWPDQVDVTTPPQAGGRSTSVIRRHAGELDVVPFVIEGIPVTPLSRTVVDLARTESFDRAVVAADAALSGKRIVAARRTTIVELLDELAGVPLRHGRARARDVVEFANAGADTPGETISRISIHRAGLPTPVLQHPFRNPTGGWWYVDFWWPECGVIGEFDGRVKYLDSRRVSGRDAAEVVLAEKHREDALRRVSRAFVRWDYETASSPAALGRLLRDAGVGA